MSRTRTAEELRSDYIASMGPELGELHFVLRNELIWIWKRWEQFRELYATNEDRVAVLNRSAPSFFYMLREMIWETVLLNLARISDPAGEGSKANLTIHRLAPLIADALLQAKVQDLVAAADASIAFARTWRNKHIAHADLAVALDRGAKALEPATGKQVVDALRSLAAVSDALDLHFLGFTTVFDSGSAPGEAPSLLQTLRYGLQAREARFARLRAGTPLPEDLSPPREA